MFNRKKEKQKIAQLNGAIKGFQERLDAAALLTDVVERAKIAAQLIKDIREEKRTVQQYKSNKGLGAHLLGVGMILGGAIAGLLGGLYVGTVLTGDAVIALAISTAGVAGYVGLLFKKADVIFSPFDKLYERITRSYDEPLSKLTAQLGKAVTLEQKSNLAQIPTPVLTEMIKIKEEKKTLFTQAMTALDNLSQGELKDLFNNKSAVNQTAEERPHRDDAENKNLPPAPSGNK